MWDALTAADQLMGKRTVKVFNVETMVQACARDTIANSRAIEYLAIFGHGMGGYQSIGAGKANESDGKRALRYARTAAYGASPLMGNAEKKLKTLNGVLSPYATILLAGCNVGEGEMGTGLLTAVSTILNDRTVQAFEWAVYWWTGYMVGPRKEARGTAVSSTWAVMHL